MLTKYLLLAANLAVSKIRYDKRNNIFGAVGIRKDGAIVYSINGGFHGIFNKKIKTSKLHVEDRLISKMDMGGEIYIARILKSNSFLTMARPCKMCQVLLKSRRIKKVYYTINNENYGLFLPLTGEDKLFSFRKMDKKLSDWLKERKKYEDKKNKFLHTIISQQ